MNGLVASWKQLEATSSWRQPEGAKMWDALETRRGIGWSLVFFFLGLTGRTWDDLPIPEREECWRWAEADCYLCMDIGFTAYFYRVSPHEGYVETVTKPCSCLAGEPYR